MKIRAIRYHDISCGHRVVGHESKCKHLHGHNYRVTFYCEAAALDEVGRVIDFGVIKSALCMWLETEWDHKFLYWTKDPVVELLRAGAKHCNSAGAWNEELELLESALVELPFNPTAENMAQYLLTEICPMMLHGTEVKVIKVEIEETRKCSVSCEL